MKGIPVALVDTSEISLGDTIQSHSTRLSIAFFKKVHYKLVVIHTVLKSGYRVLYVDSDVVLLKNPFPYLYGLKQVDMIAQRDESVLCSGFMFIYPTDKSIKLFRKAIHDNATQGDNAIIAELAKTENLDVTLLPISLFSSGYEFFQFNQYYWDLKKSPLYTFHNNYVRGGIGKTMRMKELKFYYLDSNQEYSNPNMKYITFERIRPGKHIYIGTTDDDVSHQLSLMIEVANKLNRSLIIPPIPCKKQGVEYCNLCYFHYRYCFEEILKTAYLPYKESV